MISKLQNVILEKIAISQNQDRINLVNLVNNNKHLYFKCLPWFFLSILSGTGRPKLYLVLTLPKFGTLPRFPANRFSDFRSELPLFDYVLFLIQTNFLWICLIQFEIHVLILILFSCFMGRSRKIMLNLKGKSYEIICGTQCFNVFEKK